MKNSRKRKQLRRLKKKIRTVRRREAQLIADRLLGLDPAPLWMQGHQHMASRAGKTTMFGMLYGMGPSKLAQITGIK